VLIRAVGAERGCAPQVAILIPDGDDGDEESG
jgi:hypothetical protein